jgi:putative tricarboxylic transport membrane protein
MTLELLQRVLAPSVIFLAISGTAIGIIFAAIPGLNAAIAITLFLPVTYGMTPELSLAFLGGIYMGGMYGGSITAILINVPGCVEATCTAYDGYPMTLQGRSREALYYSIFASTFGGIFGVLALVLFTPPLASVALKFGPPEMMLLGLCGLTIIGCLSGDNIWKAVFMAALGLFLGTVGTDMSSSVRRFTFGNRALTAGLSPLVVALGIFCFAEMFRDIGMSKAATFQYKDTPIKPFTVIYDILYKKFFLFLKSSLIGLFIGILPGIGGGTAVFTSYGEAKRSSKHPETFGTGNPEGIIAAESANNAVVGGALIPMLAIGIPGSPGVAIIGAALTTHGIICGPDLFTKRPDVAYIFMYAMFLTIVGMALMGILGIKWFSYILKIDMYYLIPIVIAFAIFGSYSINNRVTDVLVAVISGIVAIVLTKLQFPASPLIIGFVLSNLIEQNLRRTIQLAGIKQANFIFYILQRPLSLFLCFVLAGLIVLFVFMNPNTKKKLQD